MEKVFTVVLPLFAMIFSGFWIVRAKVVGAETVKGLVGIVFWLFLPCFIFMKTLSAHEHGDIDWRLLFAYYSACVLVFLMAALGGRILWGGNARTACLRGLASISGVVGYMGLPLLVMAFGDRATLPTLMIVMADNFVILAGGAIMMEITTPRAPGEKLHLSHFFSSTLKSILTNPLILAVLCAVAFIALNLTLPQPFHVFITQMSNATAPLALVALGAALAVHKGQGLTRPDAVGLSLLKVAVLPLLVFISTRYLFGLDDFLVKIAILMAALPVAVNVFIMAARYKTYEAEISSTMLLSAILGIGMISVLMVVLN